MSKIFALVLLLPLAACGKDDDVATVTKDMKVCRDGGGKPALVSDSARGLHIICWPKERL